ncbi:putative signaling protein [Fundidesulfovibrio magnetotacticus]|uniref:Putative signaling protein n=1 Tax=Fundidesulfovibrio magnetotacticus TaxID=2730080 RepID=A0A6V8LQY1_9BACT|nr:EAL domain-containing protein [Fundidesulfovibrio magnetotacticus]GFK94124.1 putative signaling protein [Fundidesulfovibrio magnetotacticus]
MNGAFDRIFPARALQTGFRRLPGLVLKVLLPVLLTWLISSLALFAIFSRQAERQGYDDLRARLEAYASDKANELSSPLWNFQHDLVARLMQSYRHNDDLLVVSLHDAAGKLLHEALGTGPPPKGNIFETKREIVHKNADRAETLGTLTVVFHDGRLLNSLAEYRARDALNLGLVLAVLALSLWWTVHRIVGRPLARLEKSLLRNAREPSREPIVWAGQDELARVAAAYNGLLEEVDRRTGELVEANAALAGEIVRRNQAEEKLLLAAKVFEVAVEGVAVTDVGGVIRSVNSSFERITGYRQDEAVGRRLDILGSGRHTPAFFAGILLSLRRHGAWEGEIWNRRKNGEVYPQRTTASAVLDAAGRISHYVCVFQDITEAKRQQQAMERMAFHDTLTGLPNRANLDERLRQTLGHAARHGGAFSLLFLDLDNFKAVNDSLGHDVGDALLAILAARLRNVLRAEDTLARQGGDEFIILAPDADTPDKAANLAQRVASAMRKSVPLQGYDIPCSASVGIAMYPQDGVTPQDLIKHADMAMYRAKSQGGGASRFFATGMDLQARKRLSLETRLHKALERDEFSLQYQPVLQADTMTVSGAEALLRWNCGGQSIPPAEFIPVAESNNAIIPIGAWVLERASLQAAALARGPRTPFTLSVNVSARQFHHEGFLNDVTAAAERLAGTNTRLHLELTESALIIDPDAATRTIHLLKEMGVGIVLDDFGTGYSSLKHLLDLPIDGFKIDRGFVSAIHSCARSRAIITALVNLSLGLSVSVVAEGVENTGQLDFLRGTGCPEFQGFLAWPALPLESFPAPGSTPRNAAG